MTEGPQAAPLASEREVRDLIAGALEERGALLPVLHALNEAFGYIDQSAMSVVADVLNLSEAEVYGVATFYKDFHLQPQGRSVVRICRGEACQAMGAETLVASAERRVGVPMGATSQDGSVSLDQVFCLGNCALGPSVMVDGATLGRVTESRLDEIVKSAKSAKSAKRAKRVESAESAESAEEKGDEK